MRAAPCHRRAEEVEGYDEAAEQLLETDAQGDGWVATGQASQQSTAEASIPDMDDNPNQAGVGKHAVGGDDDDIPDIDDLVIEDEDDEVDMPLQEQAEWMSSVTAYSTDLHMSSSSPANTDLYCKVTCPSMWRWVLWTAACIMLDTSII